MVSLDKRPYQHMIPPISNNRVKKGLNPNHKVSDRSKGGQKICKQKVDNLPSPLFHVNNKNSFAGKRSVTDCGSVASDSVATNTLVQQGISTSNKFAALMEGSWEDDFASFQDDLPSDSSNSHVNGTTPTRTIVSVTSRSPRLPTGSYIKNHVELPQCQPLLVGKTYDINDLRKTSFKGNKNKTGFLDQGFKQSLAGSICCELDTITQQLSVCTDNIGISSDSQLEKERLHNTFDQRKTIPGPVFTNILILRKKLYSQSNS